MNVQTDERKGKTWMKKSKKESQNRETNIEEENKKKVSG